MNLNTLSLIALVLAGIPCLLFLVNLLAYRQPAGGVGVLLPNAILKPRFHVSETSAPVIVPQSISVLIPARNEETNIRATLAAVLANRGVEFEVIVMDDHSTDLTASIVAEIAARDERVLLVPAPELPAGWCGKPHACWQLAKHARHGLFLFIDADVRLAPDALARMSSFMNTGRADLVSGVPRQELGTFSERLLLPLIHFLLLGYLPMHFMRWSKSTGFGTGCGQLFLARAEAYRHCGGHSTVRGTLHDGLKLPKAFRRAGFRTDLFDATPLAGCRMYRRNAEVWQGLAKNATEGLAAPATIAPMTLLLLGGQVLPFSLLGMAPFLSPVALLMAVTAALSSLLPRLIAVPKFKQPIGSALLHPFAILALLIIQWTAFIRWLAGKPATWKGRDYCPSLPVVHLTKSIPKPRKA